MSISKSNQLRFGQVPKLFVEYMMRSGKFNMPIDHYHSYYEIYYMLSGKRIYFVKDQTYTVEEGDIVFINKHVLHKTLYAGESSHERVIIHFDDRFPAEISAAHARFLLSPFHQNSPVIRLPRQEQLGIQQLVRRTLSEIERRQIGYDILPAHAVTELLLTVARYLETHEPLPLHHDSPIHSKISEVVRYINAHYTEPMNLQMLSGQFYISPYYLSRMFKEVTGFSFTDYLALTRIKEAQRLLRESKLKVTEIADQVGFDNFSHFGKTFKKITRVSPRAYRNYSDH